MCVCVCGVGEQDKDGVLWSDKLIRSARKEFEDARHERDPTIIARLLIGLYIYRCAWVREGVCV